MNLTIMIKKELTDIVRSKKLLILVILFAFIAISSPILAKLMPVLLKSIPQTPGITISVPDPTWKDAIDQLIKNLSQIGMIVIIFIFAGSVTEEKTKKTLELVLTKPISRPAFILSKFLSSILVAKLVFIIAMIVFYLYTISILGSFSLLNFFWLSLFLLIYLILVLSLTLFFSTISASSITAIGLTFLAQIIFATFIGYIKSLQDYSPTYILGHYEELMQNGFNLEFLPPIFISLGLIIILTLASTSFFQKHEVER